MNSGGTPGGILLHHPPNENSSLGIDPWPAKPLGPRSKAPEQSKAGPMPRDNGLGFDDDQDVIPRRPEPAEKCPKQPILDAQPRARILSLEDAYVVAKGQDLKAEAVIGTKENAQAVEERKEKRNHGSGLIAYASIPAAVLIP